MKEEATRLGVLRDELEAGLLAIPGTRVNGNLEHRLYNTTNVLFEGCDSDAMIMGLEGIAVSNGSACTAASMDPSHVLLAIGLDEIAAFSCLRFSLGRFNDSIATIKVLNTIKVLTEQLRSYSTV